LELKWAETADRDLRDIEAFVAGDRPIAAVKLVLEIIDHAAILRDHPRFGRVGRRKGTRELIFGRLPYILVYRIRGNTIEILRVLHTSRKWP
jgi:addiction module RelE/StbE family toxin